MFNCPCHAEVLQWASIHLSSWDGLVLWSIISGQWMKGGCQPSQVANLTQGNAETDKKQNYSHVWGVQAERSLAGH